MTYIFDGKQFAEEKIMLLTEKITKLKRKKVVPKLVSIIVGDNPVGLFYANLKKRKALKMGINVDIVNVPEKTEVEVICKLIDGFNKKKTVHGIMLQLPLSPNFSEEDTKTILDSIAPKKDVDGLGDRSVFSTPTVKAVIEILREADKYIPEIPEGEPRVLVVGYTGFEGGGIYRALKDMGFRVEGANSKTADLISKTLSCDILISATGVEGLITGNMVKEGVVAIDVGSPKGDILWDQLVNKASFISPVPGGVGPMTVYHLFENLVVSAAEEPKH